MPKFIVKHTAILHDGKRYDIGSEIELTAEQAENISLNLNAVENAPEKTKPTAVTEEDVAMAEENIAAAEAEKTAEETPVKGKKK